MFGWGTYGHVAIITGVSGSSIYVLVSNICYNSVLFNMTGVLTLVLNYIPYFNYICFELLGAKWFSHRR